MKRRVIFTAVAVLAIATTAVASFTACNGKSNGSSLKKASGFNIADYAVDVAEELKDGASAGVITSSKKLITSATELFSAKPAEISGSGDLRVISKTVSGEKTYSVYNLALGKYVLTGSTVMPTVGTTGGLPIITLDSTYSSSSDYTYEVRLSDGTILLNYGTYKARPTVESYNAYVGSDKKTSRVYKISTSRVSTVSSATNNVSAFVQRIVDEDTSEVTYKVVPLNSLKLYSPEYGKGEVVDTFINYGEWLNNSKPYEGPLNKVSIERVSSTLTNIYYDGNKVGELDNRVTSTLGFVGKNLYYNYVTNTDPYATSGFNYVSHYVSQSSSSVNKSNVELRSMDLTTGSTKSYNYDFVARSITAVYNHKTKDYDAAVIYGNSKTDGVAYSGYDAVSYLVDADLKMACDLTNYGDVDNVYSIGGGKYVLGSCIVDENLNYIGSISGTYYSDEKLEKFSVTDGYVYTDVDHKVVIEPKYTGASNFFGGYMYGMENNLSGNNNRVIIKKDGTVRSLEECIVDEERDTVTVDTYLGVYTVKNANIISGSSTSYTYKVYNFAGTLLFSYTSLYDTSAPVFSGKYATYTATVKDEATLVSTAITHVIKLA